MSNKVAIQDPDAICETCKGKKSTHFDEDGNPITQHQFTTEESDDALETREQRAKKEAKKKAAQRPGLSPGTMMGLGVNPLAIGRLVEVLLEKEILVPEEALYVAGMGEKPKAEE
jgi:hypothetical protein